MNDVRRAKLQAAALLAIGIAPAEFNWAYNPHLVNHPIAFWTIDTLRWTLLPLAVYLIGRRNRLFTNNDLGFSTRLRQTASLKWFIAALIIVPYGMGQIDAYMQDAAGYVGDWFFFPSFFNYQQMQPAHPGPLHWLTGFYLAATAGIVEEFYYRGLLRHLIGRSPVRALLFVIVSTALFCPPHIYGGSADVAAAAMYALMAAILYLWLGNIWPLILGHMLIDLRFFT